MSVKFFITLESILRLFYLIAVHYLHEPVFLQNKKCIMKKPSSLYVQCQKLKFFFNAKALICNRMEAAFQLSLLLRVLKLIWQINTKIDMGTRNTFRVCYVKLRSCKNYLCFWEFLKNNEMSWEQKIEYLSQKSFLGESDHSVSKVVW